MGLKKFIHPIVNDYILKTRKVVKYKSYEEALSYCTADAYQASTSELYGLVQEIPQKETTPFYRHHGIVGSAIKRKLEKASMAICLPYIPVNCRKPISCRCSFFWRGKIGICILVIHMAFFNTSSIQILQIVL